MIVTICSDEDLHRRRASQRHRGDDRVIDSAGVVAQRTYYEPFAGDGLARDATVSAAGN